MLLRNVFSHAFRKSLSTLLLSEQTLWSNKSTALSSLVRLNARHKHHSSNHASIQIPKLAKSQIVKNRRCFANEAPPVVWDYDEHGPNTWGQAFPEGCGSHQSPIDINTSASWVNFDPLLGPILLDYQRCKATTIFNSGHSFQVNFSLDSPATISGGPLGNQNYQLVQFHGHWGPSHNVHGSEHTINHHSYPAELHFVHFNKDKYGSMKEAIKHEDGLAVIGVFLRTNPKEKPHPELQTLIEDMKDIDYNKHEVSLHFSIHPQELMPSNLDHYFTYPGSLTTPPLSQCIVWIVVAEPLLVSSKQLEHFHHLHRPRDKHEIDHNYRPVMPINDRVVRASFPNYADHRADGPIEG